MSIIYSFLNKEPEETLNIDARTSVREIARLLLRMDNESVVGQAKQVMLKSSL